MDPVQFGPLTNPMLNPTTSFMFVPRETANVKDTEDYLTSLDSDTRDYVVKHTDEFRSIQDIKDCVYQLHHSHKAD